MNNEYPPDGELPIRARTSRGTLIRTLPVSEESAQEKVGLAQFSHVQQLSDEQSAVLKAILDWIPKVQKNSGTSPYITVGGYAGTGKTVTLGFLAKELESRGKSVAFATLTGKAASVLGRSLAANGVVPAYCGTIHRMLYRPVVDEATGVVTGWEKGKVVHADIIVIDEGSMVSSALLEDIRELGRPIIIVGDHGQLPPVGESLNLMAEPHLRLETVRRQALDNPIIALSLAIREDKDWRKIVKSGPKDSAIQYINLGMFSSLIMQEFKTVQDRPMDQDPLVLCGMNRTRNQLNQIARLHMKDKPLNLGERVVCLKNQYFGKAVIANGFRGKVTRLGVTHNPHHLAADVLFPDEGLELSRGIMCKEQFGQEKMFQSFKEVSPTFEHWDDMGLPFDYGYAMTVHKAQGSQADRVFLMAERFGDPTQYKRWMYTAVTRASKSLVISF